MVSLKRLLPLACLVGVGESTYSELDWETAESGPGQLVIAQSSSAYTDQGITFQGITDATHTVTYGFVFPLVSDTTREDEFIGEIIVPAANKWVGLAYGGQMVGDVSVH